jgi:hypothetical protein
MVQVPVEIKLTTPVALTTEQIPRVVEVNVLAPVPPVVLAVRVGGVAVNV